VFPVRSRRLRRGELTVYEAGTTRQIKLPAGHAVLYSGSHVHEVTPVTRGDAWRPFSGSRAWCAAMPSGAAARARPRASPLRETSGESERTVALAGTYHNLLRMWADYLNLSGPPTLHGYCKYERFAFIIKPLQPASQSRFPAMIVCVCNRISDREIARHVHAGMDFSDIQLELAWPRSAANAKAAPAKWWPSAAPPRRTPPSSSLLHHGRQSMDFATGSSQQA
jgi:hypothetical protein